MSETFDSFEAWYEALTQRFTRFLNDGVEIDPMALEGDLTSFWIEGNEAGCTIEGGSYWDERDITFLCVV